MAPERFADNQITPSVDIYALACVVYETLTGSPPFPSQSQEALIGAHLSSPPPRPSLANPRVPPAFDDVIARGMAKEPDDRYGSAGALARAAGRALRGTGRTATDPHSHKATEYQSWSPRPTPATPPTRPTPPPRPTPPVPASPPPMPQPSTATRERGRGMVIAAMALAAALVLGAIGVIIGLLINKNPAPAPTAAPLSPTVIPSSSPNEEPPTPNPSSPIPSAQLPSRPPAAAQPPLVTGPDQSASHQSCDDGSQLNNASGFGTRGGRGSQ